MKTISYKGKIADGSLTKITLRTIKGKIGYKINKFQIMPNNSSNNYEITTKIYSVKQTTVDSIVDFSDDTLLAAAFTGLISGGYAGAKTIIQDNTIFNQDIYINAEDLSASQDTNYYLELEQIQLSDLEATMATLKDIRSIEDDMHV